MTDSVGNKKVYESFSGHGMDVAINRADDLDKILLTVIGQTTNPSVIDLGCGAGGHSLRLLAAGAVVTAIDKHDLSYQIKSEIEKRGLTSENFEYIHGDITGLKDLVRNQKFSHAYCQRTIHYLKYFDALVLLKTLYEIVEKNLYISVTGTDSQIATNYPHINTSLHSRFSTLHPVQAEIFGIHEPVCLYSEKEFEQLLQESGWKIERIWKSAFGNVKAICTH